MALDADKIYQTLPDSLTFMKSNVVGNKSTFLKLHLTFDEVSLNTNSLRECHGSLRWTSEEYGFIVVSGKPRQVHGCHHSL